MVFALCALVAARDSVVRTELDVFRVFNNLPRPSAVVLLPTLQVGSALAIAVAAGVAFYLSRIRLGAKLVVAGTLGWLTAWVVQRLVERPGPGLLLEDVKLRATGEVVFAFPSQHVVVAAALAAVAMAYVGPKLRRRIWWIVAAVGVAAMFAGRAMPVDVIGGVALGWFEGYLLHLLWGAPGRRTSPELVARECEAAGLGPVDVQHVRGRPWSGPEYLLTTQTGEVYSALVLRKPRARGDRWYRARRFLASLEELESPRFASPRHEVEHRAYVSLMAERAGVRTPHVVLARALPDGSAVLVQRRIEGRPLDALAPDEVDGAILLDAWSQVSRLRQGRIAHHELTPDHLVVDEKGQVWVTAFEEARTGASDALLAQDVAEMLVTTGAVVGPTLAAAAAEEMVGPDALGEGLRFLQPLALPTRVRRLLRTTPDLLAELRLEVADRTGTEPPRFRPRIQPTTVLALAVLGGSVYILLPRVGDVSRLAAAVRAADWGFLALAAAFSAVTFPFAAIGYMGAVERRLPVLKTVAIQVASAFTSRVTPAGLGGMGLNAIFLERTGIARQEAIAAIALNHTAGAVVHAVGVFAALALIGSAGIGGLHVPTGWPVWVSVAAGLAIVGVVASTPWGRRRIVRPVREIASSLVRALRHPLRAGALFGGSAGVTLANGMALVACLWAFGAEFAIVPALAVYVGGSAVAAPSPTPGNLGAVEAALLAGLAGIGVPTTQAVAAVLTFRLLTFWIPILPGLATFRVLQRRQVL